MSSEQDPTTFRARDGGGRRRRGVGEEPAVGAEDFRSGFGEDLATVLDLDTWRAGRNLGEEYRLIEREVRQAVEAETEHQAYIRREIHPLLETGPSAPPGAGRHAVPLAEIAQVHRTLLFNGAVEACDGTTHDHDSLALTIHQVGVALVSYAGGQDCWQLRLFRKDLRQRGADPVDAVVELLQRRERRGGGLHRSPRDVLSELARRGLMSFGERAALAAKAHAPWRMGHGSPAPLELICAYMTDLVIESIKVVRCLVNHRRFVFVASEPSNRALLTIGQGLHPLEYAIVGTLRDLIADYLEEWTPAHPATVSTTWDGRELSPQEWVIRFRDEVAPQVVYGLYRATRLAPPQLFYAHVEQAHVAARIALADSVLLEQRGFPALIDLADRVCRSVYGGGTLQDMAAAAYAAAGAPFRFQSERSTREP